MLNNYTIVFSKAAEKEIHKIPQNILSKISEKINSLQATPFPDGYKKLKWFTVPHYEYSNYYRIRVWDYRVIYVVEKGQLKIMIIRVRHRKEVY